MNLTQDSKVESLKKSTNNSLLILGQNDSENLSLAKQVAEQLLEIEDFDSYPYKLLISSEDKKTIGVDKVRQLQTFIKLKVPTKKPINRAVILVKCQTLTIEAQNALLKILEEPPKGCVLILTCEQESALLPTVLSRLTKINNPPPKKQDLKKTYVAFSDEQFDKAYAISSNDPALLDSLLNSENHALIQAADLAKTLLQKSTYERLLMIDQIYKDSELTKNLIYIFERMALVSLESSDKNVAKWKTILSLCYEAKAALDNNAQARLVLTNLFINM